MGWLVGWPSGDLSSGFWSLGEGIHICIYVCVCEREREEDRCHRATGDYDLKSIDGEDE